MATTGSNGVVHQQDSEEATTTTGLIKTVGGGDTAKSKGGILPRIFLVICAFFVIVGSESFFSILRPSAHTIEAHVATKDEPHQTSASAVRKPRPSNATNVQTPNATKVSSKVDEAATSSSTRTVDSKGQESRSPKAEPTPPSALDIQAEPHKVDSTSSSTRSSSTGMQPVVGVASATDVKLAEAFVLERKEVYHKADLDYRWKLRGIGYLYNVHKVVLLASLPPVGPSGKIELKLEPDTPNTQSIVIRNVNEESAASFECDKLTIWVRVSGPEIFADSAVAVADDPNASSCYWKFDFDLRVPGSYEVDVKVLLWNGEAPIGGEAESQCSFTRGPMPNETLATYKHDGFLGFKMYRPLAMCCEICARTPHCKAWSTPFMRLNETWSGRNGCELMFEPNAPNDVLPISSLWPPPQLPVQRRSRRRTRRRSLRSEVDNFHGLVHTNPTAYFCGCGWSFWFTLDFPCLSGDLDDRVFMTKSKFVAELATTTTRVEKTETLPMCTLPQERIGEPTQGRWVRDTWPNRKTCPSPYENAPPKSKSFPMTKFDDKYPWCWHREDLSKIGNKCLEMNCALIDRSMEWHSHIHLEKEFYGVWRPYDCNYAEFTTSQLQECVTKKKIVSFKSKGASIAEFLGEFVNHRLADIKLFSDKSDPEALTVVYDTLALLHKSGPDKIIEDFVATLPEAPANEEHYWISAFFLSSEREVHAHVLRMQQYNRFLAKNLEAKKYKMINGFDLTAAFTYDSATQMDGMHIVGPPMKMIITKMFHHLCKDVVDGTPV